MNQKRAQKKEQETAEYLTARRIIDLREERGWQKQDLAARMGVTPGCITKIESGETRNMSDDTLHKCAEAFGVSTDYLQGRTDIRAMKQYEVKSLGLTDGAMENLQRRKAVRLFANLLLADPRIEELAEYVCFYVHGNRATQMDAVSEMMSDRIGDYAEFVGEGEDEIAQKIYDMKICSRTISETLLKAVYEKIGEILDEGREQSCRRENGRGTKKTCGEAAC